MSVVNQSEVLGQLHSLVKKGKVANTTSTTDSSAAIAGWIIANIYDTERFKGENRVPPLNAIAQAMAVYKGDI